MAECEKFVSHALKLNRSLAGQSAHAPDKNPKIPSWWSICSKFIKYNTLYQSAFEIHFLSNSNPDGQFRDYDWSDYLNFGVIPKSRISGLGFGIEIATKREKIGSRRRHLCYFEEFEKKNRRNFGQILTWVEYVEYSRKWLMYIF